MLKTIWGSAYSAAYANLVLSHMERKGKSPDEALYRAITDESKRIADNAVASYKRSGGIAE